MASGPGPVFDWNKLLSMGLESPGYRKAVAETAAATAKRKELEAEALAKKSKGKGRKKKK